MTLKNIFITSSLALLLLTGCTHTVKEVVFVEASCPHIEVISAVPAIDGNITEGCVCGDQLTELLQGTVDLRRSEGYYIKQVSKYNKEFTNTIDNE